MSEDTKSALQFGPGLDEIRAKMKNNPPPPKPPHVENPPDIEGMKTTVLTADILRGMSGEEGPAPQGAEAEPDTKAEEPAESDDPFEKYLEESQGVPYSNTSYDNVQVRTEIEKTLRPLDFNGLVSTGRVSQEVQINNGMRVVFQSVTGKDELFISQEAYKSSGSGGVTFSKTYTLMEMAVGIHSINGELLPGFMTTDKDRDGELFKKRWESVADYDVRLLEPLHCNLRWFQDRVGQLSVPKQLKNG